MQPIAWCFFTKGKHMVVKQISSLYGVDEENLIPISDGFQNLVYTNHNVIFRITNTIRRSLIVLEAELAFIQVLADKGIPVSKPIHSIYGNLIENIDDHHIVIAFEKAHGKSVDVTNNDVWNTDLFFQWGKILGRMHASANEIKVERPEWSAENPDVLNLLPKINSEPIKERYVQLLMQLTKYEKNPDCFGLIHNDLHQGNFFVENGKITVFDFDDCAYNWFAYDLAVCYYHAYWQTTAFTPENKDFSHVFWEYFLKGYKQEHVFKKELIQQIPIFLKIREIFLYALFLEKWDLNHLEEWQEYTLADLRKNIKSSTPYSAIDFSTLW